MKTFWISLTLFLCLLAGILTNCVYVNRTVSHLEQLIREIPEESWDASASLQKLSDYWTDQQDKLGFSVNYTELNEIEKLILSLQVHALEGNQAEFERNRLLLSAAVEEIRRLEQINLRILH